MDVMERTEYSFISLSDVHTPKKSEDSREKEEIRKDCIELRTQIQKKIMNSNPIIDAVVFVGDSAGGYGRKSETKGFKNIWFNPLKESLKTNKKIFLIPGNHDCYWESRKEGKVSEMREMIKEEGGYIYHRTIGPVNFLSLGLYPSLTEHQKDDEGDNLFKTNKPSLEFLDEKLTVIGKEAPVVIGFHYPLEGKYSDWFSKKEKDHFFNAIQGYNVVAILVGHRHSRNFSKFRNSVNVIQAANRDAFALITYNINKPKTIAVKWVFDDGQERDQSIESPGISNEAEAVPSTSEPNPASAKMFKKQAKIGTPDEDGED